MLVFVLTVLLTGRIEQIYSDFRGSEHTPLEISTDILVLIQASPPLPPHMEDACYYSVSWENIVSLPRPTAYAIHQNVGF